ncbi:Mu-like prophage major head subunit gpT family protein [Aestuariivirga sp. YIM B02566]|uniref:Mu-like prophage major head subunit gpT family protein n=1 Tax=Taklimakanibacter albus TaxID=2800327 RepID=A0ACC5R6H5_9HYPH|nr:Mu-like prophage major head subunit gpT family protein [Aestuariivirga sp. YIM B02566]MBK1868261.1 Mu-like prophage major head subunit gpT family protein [Aestuariivirga sp. YIM B02566]
MDINRTTLDSLYTGYKRNFSTGFGKVKPLWQRIATRIGSTTSQNVYPMLGDFPGMREWIGDRQLRLIGMHDYTIKNRDWEDSVRVKRNSIMDDEFGIYAPFMEGLGAAAAEHPDVLVFGALKDGFSSICYDGQNFFDTDHPVGGVGDTPVTTKSNMQAGAGAPWFLLDTSRPLLPLIFQERKKADRLDRLDDPTDPNVFHKKEFIYGVDGRYSAGYGFWQLAFGSKDTLNAANFKSARTAMETQVNDSGSPLGVSPKILVVGPTLRDAGEDILKKEQNSGGETNTLRNAVELVVVPWLV